MFTQGKSAARYQPLHLDPKIFNTKSTRSRYTFTLNFKAQPKEHHVWTFFYHQLWHWQVGWDQVDTFDRQSAKEWHPEFRIKSELCKKALLYIEKKTRTMVPYVCLCVCVCVCVCVSCVCVVFVQPIELQVLEDYQNWESPGVENICRGFVTLFQHFYSDKANGKPAFPIEHNCSLPDFCDYMLFSDNKYRLVAAGPKTLALLRSGNPEVFLPLDKLKEGMCVCVCVCVCSFASMQKK